MDLLQELSGARRIGISGHVRPDGDCIGACLSLYLFLRDKMPDACVQIYLQKPQDTFSGLPGFDTIITDFPDAEAYDVYVALDCNEERLGDAGKYFHAAGKRINIDHHVSNTGCGDVNLVIPDASSTCEILYDLIGEENITREIAGTLYLGIIHDTGVFRYADTTQETMRKGAFLIGFGFDFARMIQETFVQKTYVQAQITGRALMESIRFLDGHCIVSCIDRKTMDFYNVESKDLDGIVNQLRNITGISCAIFMYQTKPLEYKVSLRTDENVNAARVAMYFGGGGHVRAAGCTMQGTFYDCVNNLSLLIEKELRESKCI